MPPKIADQKTWSEQLDGLPDDLLYTSIKHGSQQGTGTFASTCGEIPARGHKTACLAWIPVSNEAVPAPPSGQDTLKPRIILTVDGSRPNNDPNRPYGFICSEG